VQGGDKGRVAAKAKEQVEEEGYVNGHFLRMDDEVRGLGQK
jgi:hypothetical protein